MDVHAHRGSPDPGSGILENTIDAFLRSARLGADGVELDVRLTRDGALAVHHDPVTPDGGPVADLDVCQLPAHVPLLDAALEARTGLTVNIEIKNLPTRPGSTPGSGWPWPWVQWWPSGAGLTIAAWTVNELSALRSALDWGVDTVITDDVVSAAALVAATLNGRSIPEPPVSLRPDPVGPDTPVLTCVAAVNWSWAAIFVNNARP